MKIKLTQGKFAIVDKKDFDFLNQFKWFAYKSDNNFYAKRSVIAFENGIKKTKTIRMHRFILKAKKGQYVDHVNHNGLDNRRKNLRLCSNAENIRNQRKRACNTSGFRGVYWHGQTQKWIAQIKVNYKGIALGYFENKIDAAIAYDKAAIKFHKKFAMTNKKMGLLNANT